MLANADVNASFSQRLHSHLLWQMVYKELIKLHFQMNSNYKNLSSPNIGFDKLTTAQTTLNISSIFGTSDNGKGFVNISKVFIR